MRGATVLLKASKLSLKTARKTPNLGGRIVQNGRSCSLRGLRAAPSPLPPPPSPHFAPAAARSFQTKARRQHFDRKENKGGGGDHLNKGQTLEIWIQKQLLGKGFSSTKMSGSAPGDACKLVCWLPLVLLKPGVDAVLTKLESAITPPICNLGSAQQGGCNPAFVLTLWWGEATRSKGPTF